MKTLLFTGLLVAIVSVSTIPAFGLGADYPQGQPVGGTTAWPSGLKELANNTNRMHGFFVNAQDTFFYAGAATNFSQFLSDYSRIHGIEKHRLILHAGNGEAKSPWDKERGKPCDWKLFACPKSWMANDGTEKGFVLEVHFWTEGKISFDHVSIPKNVSIARDAAVVPNPSEKHLADLNAIKPGMTRAEVLKRLSLDGGLQGASPMRLAHPEDPSLKVDVEFDFKRNAADQNRAITADDDKVIHVSKPYFERPYSD